MVLGIAIVYLLILAAAFTFQNNLIFHPGTLPEDFAFNNTAEELFLKTKDGEKINALFYRGQSKNVILYFHGNAGDLSGWQYVAEDFVDKGYSVLLIDYRGYGKSTGKISEAGLYEDAETAWKYLVDQKKFHPNQIIIYGRSIGTGVAVELARNHPARGLILESPYSSLTTLANEKLPLLLPGLILRYRFDNIGKVNTIESPIVFFHGANDALIPPAHTTTLYETFKGKKEQVIIGGGTHNDLSQFPEYHKALTSLVPEVFEIEREIKQQTAQPH